MWRRENYTKAHSADCNFSEPKMPEQGILQLPVVRRQFEANRQGSIENETKNILSSQAGCQKCL
jgi:hypothetical protein